MDNLIDRQAALEKLAIYIHLIDKTMGKGFLTDDDCMEAAKSVLGEDELPAAQPATSCSEIPNGSDDTISRQVAIDAFYKGPKRTTRDVLAEIKTLPSAQPERKTGRWLNIDESEKWECSVCGRMMWFSSRLGVKPSDYNFCPNCGADMRGDEKK